ncbi:MAG: hypothetical protein OXL38_09750 [Gammaproteobacteria bacterium]|nr:hypothetical protein [Gammaproteobacteria bacterium]
MVSTEHWALRLAAVLVFTAAAADVNGQWRILSSSEFCQALYETDSATVELLEDSYTRAARRDLGMAGDDVNKPVLDRARVEACDNADGIHGLPRAHGLGSFRLGGLMADG